MTETYGGGGDDECGRDGREGDPRDAPTRASRERSGERSKRRRRRVRSRCSQWPPPPLFYEGGERAIATRGDVDRDDCYYYDRSAATATVGGFDRRERRRRRLHLTTKTTTPAILSVVENEAKPVASFGLAPSSSEAASTDATTLPPPPSPRPSSSSMATSWGDGGAMTTRTTVAATAGRRKWSTATMAAAEVGVTVVHGSLASPSCCRPRCRRLPRQSRRAPRRPPFVLLPLLVAAMVNFVVLPSIVSAQDPVVPTFAQTLSDDGNTLYVKARALFPSMGDGDGDSPRWFALAVSTAGQMTFSQALVGVPPPGLTNIPAPPDGGDAGTGGVAFVGEVGEFQLGGKSADSALATPVSDDDVQRLALPSPSSDDDTEIIEGTATGFHVRYIIGEEQQWQLEYLLTAAYDVRADSEGGKRDRVCGAQGDKKLIWAHGLMLEGEGAGASAEGGAAATIAGTQRTLAYHGQDRTGMGKHVKVQCSPSADGGGGGQGDGPKTVAVNVTVILHTTDGLLASEAMEDGLEAYVEGALEGVWDTAIFPDKDEPGAGKLDGQIRVGKGWDVPCPADMPSLDNIMASGIQLEIKCHVYEATLTVKGKDLPPPDELRSLVISRYDEAQRSGALSEELTSLGAPFLVTLYDPADFGAVDVSVQVRVDLYNSAGVTVDDVLGGTNGPNPDGGVTYKAMIESALGKAFVEKFPPPAPSDADGDGREAEERALLKEEEKNDADKKRSEMGLVLTSTPVLVGGRVVSCPDQVTELDIDGNENECHRYEADLEVRAPSLIGVQDEVEDAMDEALADGTLGKFLWDEEDDGKGETTVPTFKASAHAKKLGCTYCPPGTYMENPTLYVGEYDGDRRTCETLDDLLTARTLAEASPADEVAFKEACVEAKRSVLFSDDPLYTYDLSVCGYCLPRYETSTKKKGAKKADAAAKKAAEEALAESVCTLCPKGEEPCLSGDFEVSAAAAMPATAKKQRKGAANATKSASTCAEQAFYLSFAVGAGTKLCKKEQKGAFARGCGCGVKQNIFNGQKCRKKNTAQDGGDRGGECKKKNKKRCKKNTGAKSKKKKRNKKNGGNKNNNATDAGAGNGTKKKKRRKKKNGNDPNATSVPTVSSFPSSAPTVLPAGDAPTIAPATDQPVEPSPTEAPVGSLADDDVVEVTVSFGMYNSEGITAPTVVDGTALVNPNVTAEGTIKSLVEAALGNVFRDRYGDSSSGGDGSDGGASGRRRRRMSMTTANDGRERDSSYDGRAGRTGRRDAVEGKAATPTLKTRRKGGSGRGVRDHVGEGGGESWGNDYDKQVGGERDDDDDDELFLRFYVHEYLAGHRSSSDVLLAKEGRRIQSSNETNDDNDDEPLDLELVESPVLATGVDATCPSFVPAADSETGEPNVCGDYTAVVKVRFLGHESVAEEEGIRAAVVATYDKAEEDGSLTRHLQEEAKGGATFKATVPNDGLGTSADNGGTGGGGLAARSDVGAPSVNIGVIIGAAVGGVCAFFGCLGLWVWYRKRTTLVSVDQVMKEEEAQAEAARAWNEDENTGYDDTDRRAGGYGHGTENTNDTGYDQ